MTKTTKGLILSAILIFAAFACKKISTTDIGIGLIPTVDNVHTFETILEVETDNFLFNDTTKNYGSILGAGIIENDPEFGRTEATMYFQFGPNGGINPFESFDTIYVDSLFLNLAYDGLYGDSMSLQEFEVREIDPLALFKRDSVYRFNQSHFMTVPNILGSKLVNFLTLDDSLSFKKGKDTIHTSHLLRIPLDTNLARRFINYDSTNAYYSDSAFMEYFRGFQVKVSESSPIKRAIAYFDLSDENNSLTFFVRTVKNGNTDTTTIDFVYKESPKANVIDRSPGNGFLTYLNNGNPNDDLVYIQATPGSYGQIKIKGLDTLDNRVIHLAELIMLPVPSAGDEWLAKPNILFLDAINEAGDTAFTIRNDYVQAASNPYYDVEAFGGRLRNNRYAFNLSRYVQSVVTKNEPYHTLRVYSPVYTEPYYMFPNGTLSTSKEYIPLLNHAGAGRVVLGGGSHPQYKMVLRIIYSKY